MKAEEAGEDYAVGAVGTAGQRDWQVMTIEEIADVNPRIDKAAIPDDLPVSFVPMPAVGAVNGSIHVEETRPASEVKKRICRLPRRRRAVCKDHALHGKRKDGRCP